MQKFRASANGKRLLPHNLRHEILYLTASFIIASMLIGSVQSTLSQNTSIYSYGTVAPPAAPPSNPNSGNLAPMFQNGIQYCRWGDANLHNGNPYYGTIQAGIIDYTVLHDGHPSIRLNPRTPGDINIYQEIDNYPYTVKAGDHIVYRCWVKTGPKNSGGGSLFGEGGRIGLDFKVPYAANPVDGLPSGGEAANYFPATPNAGAIPWGTSEWTLLEYDFIVPYKVYDRDYGGSISPQLISAIYLWLDSREIGEQSYAWFADSELYINP